MSCLFLSVQDILSYWVLECPTCFSPYPGQLVLLYSERSQDSFFLVQDIPPYWLTKSLIYFTWSWTLICWEESPDASLIMCQSCTIIGLCPLPRHGDMLYMTLEERASSAASMGSEGAEAASFSLPPNGSSASSSSTSGATSECKEDEVDTILAKQDGKIYRDRNEQLWVCVKSRCSVCFFAAVRTFVLLFMCRWFESYRSNVGWTFPATARFQDSAFYQTAIKVVLRCILSVVFHLSGSRRLPCSAHAVMWEFRSMYMQAPRRKTWLWRSKKTLQRLSEEMACIGRNQPSVVAAGVLRLRQLALISKKSQS